MRWRKVNALETPDRAPVWCKPVGCWSEIIPGDSLICTDAELRGLEYEFRQILHKNDIGDDSPLAPWFEVQTVFDIEPANMWGVEIGRIGSGQTGGAWAYDPPLKSEADFEKLATPTYKFNKERTNENLQRRHELFGDIMPVKLRCGPGFGEATPGTSAAELFGLEQMLLGMITEPKLMHRLMGHIRDAFLRRCDAWESAEGITPNTYEPMLCSDPIGPEPIDGKYSLGNCWIAGNSQEFDQVSPVMFDEFCLEYQKPMFERFAYTCYGCCENLTKKLDQVLTIPNLRILVCSAWTGLDPLLERVSPRDYCIMWRQKASDVVFPDDNKTIRQDLEEGAKKLQGRPYQIVLRELQTLCGHKDRLHVWTDIAKEIATKYA